VSEYKWRHSPKGKLSRKRYRLQVEYGITLEAYQALVDVQRGLCAICGKPELTKNKQLAVDHCHTSGRIRGLLCFHCNTAIGLFNDSPEQLQAAIDYLRK